MDRALLTQDPEDAQMAVPISQNVLSNVLQYNPKSGKEAGRLWTS
jgi:hypothetical protein